MTQTRPVPGQPVHPISQPVPYASDREIEREVARIAELGQHDPEAAHVAADELVKTVLETIAGGHAQYAYLAVAALKVWDLDFPRWAA